MDITQILITAFAVLGIAVMGVLAVVPTVLELRAGSSSTRDRSRSVRTPARDDHELAA